MPNDFNRQFEQGPTPSVTIAPKQVDGTTAAMIKGLGEAATSIIGGVAAARQEKRDATSRDAFYSDYERIQSQEAEFYRQRDIIQQAMASSDAQTVAEYRKKMDLLKDGRISGTLTPTQATLEVNNLLKQYQINAPHLAKEFMAYANEAKGNVRAAAQELYGEDPISKQNNSDLQEAISKGTTIDRLRYYRNVQMEADLAKEQANQIISSGNAKAPEVSRSLYSVVTKDVNLLAGQIRTAILDRIKQDPKTTKEDIKAWLGSVKTQKMIGLNSAMADAQEKAQFNFTSEQQKQLADPYTNLFTNIEAELDGAPTMDNYTRRVKAGVDYAVANAQDRWVQQYSNTPWAALATSPTATAALMEADANAATEYGALADSSLTPPEIYKELRRRYIGNVPMIAAISRLEQGFHGPMYNGVASIYEGQPPNTGTPVEDAMAKNAAVKIHENTSYETRQKNIANLARGMDWEDLLVSPAIRADIKSNKEASQVAIAKASEYSAPYIGIPGTSSEMVVDFSYPGNPIRYSATYKTDVPLDMYTPITPTVPGTPAGSIQQPALVVNQDKLNQTYRDIRDVLGIDAARAWIKSLEAKGVKDVTDPSVLSQPKGPRSRGGVTASAAPAQQTAEAIDPKKDPLSFALQAKTALGLTELPDAVIKAIVGQEADKTDPNKPGQETSYGQALSAMQIIPPTFEMMNDRYFNGKLDIKDTGHQIMAALVYLNDIYLRRKRNVYNTAMEYYSGGQNPERRPVEGVAGPTTGEYAQSVTDRYNAFLSNP